MSAQETREFLLFGTRTAKLAVARRDGQPLVVPIWFVLDDQDRILFNTGETTIKARAMRRDPRVSLCVDDDAAPYSYVQVLGTAELIDDLDAVREWAERIGGRYMGAERAREFGERNGVPGELVVRVTAQRTVARARIAE